MPLGPKPLRSPAKLSKITTGNCGLGMNGDTKSQMSMAVLSGKYGSQRRTNEDADREVRGPLPQDGRNQYAVALSSATSCPVRFSGTVSLPPLLWPLLPIL